MAISLTELAYGRLIQQLYDEFIKDDDTVTWFLSQSTYYRESKLQILKEVFDAGVLASQKAIAQIQHENSKDGFEMVRPSALAETAAKEIAGLKIKAVEMVIVLDPLNPLSKDQHSGFHNGHRAEDHLHRGIRPIGTVDEPPSLPCLASYLLFHSPQS